MRIRDLTNGYERDPLLKVGVGAMIIALGFATVVAVAASLSRPMEVAVAKPEVKSSTGPLIRSDPGIDPWVERDIPSPKPQVVPPPEPKADSQPVPVPDKQPRSQPKPKPEQRTQTLPQDDGYPLPTNEQVSAANDPHRYKLPQGAIMSLSIPSIGLENVPVMDSVTTSALDRGVVHLPDTSMPWSDTPERNVYLAGHRLGWPGTGSHLVFYRLNDLDGGERITLRGKEGRKYDYRVIENFVVGPEENWVTGRVRGRDLLTLQTCTPIPTFQWRLIVRAERI